jgi:hypothetical protein
MSTNCVSLIAYRILKMFVVLCSPSVLLSDITFNNVTQVAKYVHGKECIFFKPDIKLFLDINNDVENFLIFELVKFFVVKNTHLLAST